MTDLPRGPFLTSPLEQETSGVDFLGLRQANLDMMDICLPGINNYTRYVRIFSVISWTYWMFHKQAEYLRIQEPSENQLRQFKEKVEILFNWGHKELGLSGIPGITSEPQSLKGEVELSFDSWKRSTANTSLMAAPTYGPASKTNSGLGFIENVNRSFFRTCGNGINLAESLNNRLEGLNGYADLVSFQKFSGTEELANELLIAWDVRTPSQEEKNAFKDSFYDVDSIGEKGKIAQRSLTVYWIKEILRTSKKPLAINEIRKAMAYRYIDQVGFIPLEGHTDKAWLLWFILQVRQAQRLGFEAMLAWLESRLFHSEERSIDEMLETAGKIFSSHTDILPVYESVGHLIDELENHFNSLEEYIDLSNKDRKYCIFELIDDLLKSLKKNSDGILPISLKMLLLVASLTRLITESGMNFRQLNFGGRDRVSLRFWLEIVEKWKSRSSSDFLRYIFENFILSQHFGVAASRFDGNRQRLRITIEEEGLSLMVSKQLEPFIGDDRLEMALLLLADCGEIAKTVDNSFYSL